MPFSAPPSPPPPPPPPPPDEAPLVSVTWIALTILITFLVVAGIFFSYAWCIHRATRALFDRVVERHAVDLEKFNIDACAICQESFEEGEDCCVLKACNHWYHESCIKRWLSNSLTLYCPLCRVSVANVPLAPAGS
ncbi:hypothetical protein ACJRO7_035467 [Eucalyptus globulus]|uniref:RING-type domain-containing protein n=1 Tax=Eucalyptus globulus TaxID=34317 RepID=A0ABD3JHE9_EUCGL